MANPDYWCETGVTAHKTRLQWTVNDAQYWDPETTIRSSTFHDTSDNGISWYMQLSTVQFPDGLFPALNVSADQTSKEFTFRFSAKLTNEKGEEFQSAKFSKIKYIRPDEGHDFLRSHHIIEKRDNDKWVSTDSPIKIDGFDLTNKLVIDAEVAIIGEWSSRSGIQDKRHHHKSQSQMEGSHEVSFPHNNRIQKEECLDVYTDMADTHNHPKRSQQGESPEQSFSDIHDQQHAHNRSQQKESHEEYFYPQRGTN